MKIFRLTTCVLFLNLIFATSWAADETGLKSEAEAGIIISTGNSKSQTYSLQDVTKYLWPSQVFALNGKYLQTLSNNIESANYWTLGIRFEQVVSDRFNIYLGQNVESNIYAGFAQRYNTDIGGKYTIIKEEDMSWLAEAGYRYALTNQIPSGTQSAAHLVRLYTEVNKSWDKSVSTKFWVEGMPNITNSNGYRITSELSMSVILTSVFSVKTAYLVKYDNAPPPGIALNTDTFFTTSLVGKFL